MHAQVDRPRRLGQYEIREAIGHGGMAAVYQAYQPSLDRVVALKVISSALSSEPEFMERFRQEALAIARLTHPNIVIVHDFGEDGGVPYLVMEYVDGGTLADLMDAGTPAEQVPELARQIAAGLDYAHSRGVVHRDIKPQNVLVTREGRAVVVDFGLARMMESAQRLTMSGGIVGTPEYMSPEQAAGRPTDHRTDLYALGVILYEMVVGVRPFQAESPLGVLMKHLQEPPPPPRQLRPEVLPAVEEVLLKALAKKPEERYQTAGELAKALQAALSGTATTSAPVAQPPAPPAAQPAAAPAPTPTQPPELDLSKYAGLRTTAERTTRPHQTPSLAAQAAAAPPPVEAPPEPPKPKTRTCPSCQANIPPDVSICPNCMYLLPFDEVATQPARKEPERKQVRVNLLPYSLRWDPTGLARARQITQQTVNQFASQGWELVTPLEAAGTFVSGRSAAGQIIQGAVITLQRLG